MTTLTQNQNSLFIDREGVNIPNVKEDTHEEAAEVSRSNQPFSELKSGKFRRMFNRHSFIR